MNFDNNNVLTQSWIRCAEINNSDNSDLLVCRCERDIDKELLVPEPGEDGGDVGGVVVPLEGILMLHLLAHQSV